MATIMKVKTSSEAKKIASALTALLNKDSEIELHSIGAGAVNQAIKAVAIARGFTAAQGVDLMCIPGFITVNDDGQDFTGMKLVVKKI